MTSTVDGQRICEDCKKLNRKNTRQNSNKTSNNNITLQKSCEVSNTKNNSALKTHNNESNMGKSNPNNNSQIPHKPDQQDITAKNSINSINETLNNESEKIATITASTPTMTISKSFMNDKRTSDVLSLELASTQHCKLPESMLDLFNKQFET